MRVTWWRRRGRTRSPTWAATAVLRVDDDERDQRAVDAVEADGERVVEPDVVDPGVRPGPLSVPRREGEGQVELQLQVALRTVVVVPDDVQHHHLARSQPQARQSREVDGTDCYLPSPDADVLGRACGGDLP